jgi:titin
VSGISKINSVDLTWEVPSDDGGSSITSYSVQYSSDNGSSWSLSNDPVYLFADDVSTTRNGTVTNLSSSNSYVFRVAAVNSVGSGSYSLASNSVSPGGVVIPDCDLIINDTTSNYLASFDIDTNFIP